MIRILGNNVTTESISQQYISNSTEILIAKTMLLSEKIFYYNSYNQLRFELNLRAKIINAARELYKSKLAFKTFRESKCNPEFWKRTEEGGFQLKSDVKSFRGINDIFINTNLYGTECATAIIIIFYKAVADIFNEELFDSVFTKIYLMNWKKLDRTLGVKTYNNISRSIPGDCVYFKNPEVNPLKMEWQGENAVNLGDDMFYGHGIGITTADSIINALNDKRKVGATVSAYLLNTVTSLGFEKLEEIYNKNN